MEVVVMFTASPTVVSLRAWSTNLPSLWPIQALHRERNPQRSQERKLLFCQVSWLTFVKIDCRAEHVPRRQADGSGRDGYIVYNNGGLYNNYKPAQFGSELRGYEVIHKPRFGKKNLEFDDY